jgi:predicted nuclease of predicted toxin-antitoxin system
VKLWFDEDLSPTLVQVAHEHGLEATCNRDRGALGHKDAQLRALVQTEDYVLVTDNASDFRPMYARDDIHPGLLIIPAGDGRARQQELTRAVIAWIANAAADRGQTSAQFMINKLVEIDSDGLTVAYDLPSD